MNLTPNRTAGNSAPADWSQEYLSASMLYDLLYLAEGREHAPGAANASVLAKLGLIEANARATWSDGTTGTGFSVTERGRSYLRTLLHEQVPTRTFLPAPGLTRWQAFWLARVGARDVSAIPPRTADKLRELGLIKGWDGRRPTNAHGLWLTEKGQRVLQELRPGDAQPPAVQQA